MPGGFASGLAKGLFGEMSNQRAQKEKQIASDKDATLKMLGGLLDRADPDSQPALLRHMGDVIGLKGNQKGIWARLTGADQESDQGALRSKMEEILGQIRGPGQLRKDTPSVDPQQMNELDWVTAGDSGQLPTRQGVMTPDRRQGGIYLRDPQEDKLEQLRTRYERAGAQKDIEYQKALINARTEGQLRVGAQRGELAAANDDRDFANTVRKDIEKAALIKAASERRTVTDADRAAAADDFAIKNNQNAALLKARIGLTEARTADTIQDTEIAGEIDPTTGLRRGSGPTFQQNRTYERQVKQDNEARIGKARSLNAQYNDARAKNIAAGQRVGDFFKRIEAAGYKYDSSNGKLYGRNIDPKTNQPQEFTGSSYKRKFDELGLKDLPAIMAEQQRADAEMKGFRNDLGRDFGDLYEMGNNEWDVRPKGPGLPMTGGVQIDPTTGGAPAQQAIQPTGPATKIGAPAQGAQSGRSARIPDVGKTAVWRTATPHKVGDTFQVGAMSFQVLGLGGSNGIETEVQVKRIK